MIIVRYADDFVVGFQSERDAQEYRQELSARLGRFGLELNAKKTRLIEFGRWAEGNRRRRGQGRPETFTFLGFLHICGRTRKGYYTVLRKTRGQRLRRKLKEIRQKMRRRRHKPIPEQGKWLRAVVQGYFNYHAVPGNSSALNSFRTEVNRAWCRQLRRRSQKHRMTWQRFRLYVDRWIPSAQILHPLPYERLSLDPR